MRPAALLAVLVMLQVALGLGAYIGRFTGLAVPGGAAVTLALPVTHRVTASLLLGLAVALALRTGQRRAAGGRRVPLGGGLASREVAA